MPATVQLNPSTRSTLRALIVVAALIVLLIPVGITVAHGASRLGYRKIDVTQDLSASVKDLKFALDTGAEVVVKTTDSDAPSVRLTGTGPRGEAPDLEVRETGTTSIVSVTGDHDFENAKIEAFVPAATSDDLSLDLSGGYGTIDVIGDYREVLAQSDGGAIEVDGSADRVRATTDWGMVTLGGTFGSLEAKTDVGAIDGVDLAVRDRVDVTSSTGAISLDFSNDMVPLSGIVAKADEGMVEVRLPRLDAARSNMAAAAADSRSEGTEDEDGGKGSAPDGDDGGVSAAALSGELFYQINATSTAGNVDVAKSLKKYDASTGASTDAAGKTVIPVTVSTETGEIEVDQN